MSNYVMKIDLPPWDKNKSEAEAVRSILDGPSEFCGMPLRLTQAQAVLDYLKKLDNMNVEAKITFASIELAEYGQPTFDNFSPTARSKSGSGRSTE